MLSATLFLIIKKIGLIFHVFFVIPTKMLSRHFYRDDEVKAALLWCLQKKRVEEGLFWLQELLDSELYDDVFKVMFKGWLWSFGIRQMGWFNAFYTLYKKDCPDEDEIVNLFYSLIRLPVIERDTSILGLLVLGIGAELEPLPSTDKVSPVHEDSVRVAFHRYSALGKARSAWILAVQLFLNDEAATWKFMIELGIPHTLQLISEEYALDIPKLTCLACAVAFLCMKGKKYIKPFEIIEVDIETAKRRTIWKQLEGRRERRQFEIPLLSLSWMTMRGSNSYTQDTLDELRGINLDTLRDNACPFWKSVADSVEENDDSIEEFWDTYFPDDRPDEWSLEDQKKSHGSGSLALNEQKDYIKYVRKWYGTSGSVILWDCMKSVLKMFESVDLGDKWHNGYTSLYVKKNLIHQKPAKLKFKIMKIDDCKMIITKTDKPILVEDDTAI